MEPSRIHVSIFQQNDKPAHWALNEGPPFEQYDPERVSVER